MNLSSLVPFALVASSALVGSSALAALPLGPDDTLMVLWKHHTMPLEAIEAEADAALYVGVVGQLDRYRTWIADNDYHVALSDDLRVIVATYSKKTSKDRLAVVAKALVGFDALLVPPDRSASDETFRGGARGVREHAPDTEPAVLIELHKEAQYQTLLARIQELHPELPSWASVQSGEPSFDDEYLMVSGWQSAPDGFEIGPVWRTKNELVNRLSRLLMYRSYGPQPHWLSQAAGWAVEQEVMGDIYCFPNRKEFIGIEEHEGWKSEVAREFKPRNSEPLQLTEFADWKRGAFQQDKAALAWAFVEFLLDKKPEALPALAEANRLAYKAGFTVDLGGSNWETNPAFIVPPEAELATLKEELGDDAMEQATKFFRTWKVARKKRSNSKRKSSKQR